MSKKPSSEASEPLRWCHVRIEGRVQGVAYRASLCAEARRKGLVGWVRNRPDGSVEALLVGNTARVDEVLAWCAKGPPLARVTRVDASPAPAEATAPPGFETRW